MDTISIAGGAFWPFAYRPDRICRQFGLDQPSRSVELGFVDFAEAMKDVMFKPPESLPSFDASLFIPPERARRVLDLWVAYYHRLKSSVRRYKQQNSMQVFPNLQIMCKDSYYVTVRARQPEEQEARAPQTKKRKLVSLNKRSTVTLPASEGPAPPSKGGYKSRKITQSDPAGVSTSPKKPSTRLSRTKREFLRLTHKSEHLKAKSRRRSLSPTSFSNPIVIRGPADRDENDEGLEQMGHTTNEVPDEVVQNSPSSPVVHETTQGSSIKTHSLGSPLDTCVVDESIAAKEVEPLPTCGSVNETGPEGIPGDSPAAALIPSDAGEKDSSASVASVLVSLLPDTDVAIVREFVSNHADISFPDSGLPPAFLKPAYTVLADFLHFIRAHTVVHLMHLYKDKIVNDLKALSLFGFRGNWFDQLVHQLIVPFPSAALEELQKATNAILEQEQRNSDIRA
ncbi:hypothetical protein SESBI_23676 [Sesbania bispinosa]|nr:hypothetical protein SESBI_23676 [Sesbania bispinosa]